MRDTATVPGNSSEAEDLSHSAYKLDESFSHLQQARIMMVDDEPIMMEMVQSFLEDAGYRSFTLVEDPTTAIDRLHETRPDLLLLDLVMPGMSGFDVLTAVRREAAFRHLPVIILTSSSDVETKLKALDLGGTDFLAKPVDPSELTLRVRNTLAVKAYQDQLAFYDVLTNLPNTRLFHDRVEWAINVARQIDTTVAVLHLVFDDLKRVIDTFDPKAGEDLLKQLTLRLIANVRASDTLSDTTDDSRAQGEVFRLGSVEFSILLPRVEGIASAEIVARRILDTMSIPFAVDGTEICLKPSIGIAGCPNDGTDKETLVRSAAGASSQALTQGGGRLQFYSTDLNDASLHRFRLEADMRRSLENEEFTLVYQPRVSVSTGEIIGAEALVRWYRDDEAISPEEFIHIAEETGLILTLGEWVLRTACRQIKCWEAEGIDVKVSVNVSARQFFDADLVEVVRSVLAETGVKPASLILEMTESLLMDRAETAVQVLHQLHDLGLEISIDDFGTGYSSFSYLKLFPMDEVKIDKSFLVDAVSSAEDQALISAMTGLAHTFGFRVCAEGVEQTDQLELLRELDCDEFQGYLFSKPIEPDALLQLIREA